MHAAVQTLKASPEFQRLTRQGRRHFASAFIMQILENGRPGVFRLGLTASRKVGNAVVRNRAKRRLREMVRLCAADGLLRDGVDVVLIAKTSAVSCDFLRMREEFLKGLAATPVKGGAT